MEASATWVSKRKSTIDECDVAAAVRWIWRRVRYHQKTVGVAGIESGQVDGGNHFSNLLIMSSTRVRYVTNTSNMSA